jgi:hypothetical protein
MQKTKVIGRTDREYQVHENGYIQVFQRVPAGKVFLFAFSVPSGDQNLIYEDLEGSTPGSMGVVFNR